MSTIDPADEPGWLHKQVEQSKREMEAWPQWLKDAARFEGRKVMPDTGSGNAETRLHTTKAPQVVGPDPAEVEVGDG